MSWIVSWKNHVIVVRCKTKNESMNHTPFLTPCFRAIFIFSPGLLLQTKDWKHKIQISPRAEHAAIAFPSRYRSAKTWIWNYAPSQVERANLSGKNKAPATSPKNKGKKHRDLQQKLRGGLTPLYFVRLEVFTQMGWKLPPSQCIDPAHRPQMAAFSLAHFSQIVFHVGMRQYARKQMGAKFVVSCR